jgi:hypothetical protein
MMTFCPERGTTTVVVFVHCTIVGSTFVFFSYTTTVAKPRGGVCKALFPSFLSMCRCAGVSICTVLYHQDMSPPLSTTSLLSSPF